MAIIEWEGFTNRQLREIEKHLDKKLEKLRRKDEQKKVIKNSNTRTKTS